MDVPEPRPVYRHIVVWRKGFAKHTMSAEDRREIMAWEASGKPITDLPARLQVYVVKDTTKGTRARVFGIPEDEDEDEYFRDRPDLEKPGKQSGIIVARLHRHQIPGTPNPEEGGVSSLPLHPQTLHHPGYREMKDPEADFLRAAQGLQKEFQRVSDTKFMLIPQFQRHDCSLVTVVYSPIMAMPREDKGFELQCEFHQTTRFGTVDTAGFDVYSDTGDYPIQPPGTIEMVTMVKTKDELGGVLDSDRINRRRIAKELQKPVTLPTRMPEADAGGGAQVSGGSGVRLRGGTEPFKGGLKK